MKRYFIYLSYNGTEYNGWQRQPSAPSVQQRLEEALSQILREEIAVVGCGRTDTGVHASYYVAHFESQNFETSNSDRFCYHLNCILPSSIAVSKIEKVDSDTHARFGATKREYTYIIETKKSPFNIKTAHTITTPLNLEKMNSCAAKLMQYSDFTSFAKLGSDNKTSICTIFSASWSRDNDRLVFKIAANRFLRNMVRAITGTIIEVGKGKKSVENFVEIIEKCQTGATTFTAPAHGLYLSNIEYSKTEQN